MTDSLDDGLLGTMAIVGLYLWIVAAGIVLFASDESTRTVRVLSGCGLALPLIAFVVPAGGNTSWFERAVWAASSVSVVAVVWLFGFLTVKFVEDVPQAYAEVSGPRWLRLVKSVGLCLVLEVLRGFELILEVFTPLLDFVFWLFNSAVAILVAVLVLIPLAASIAGLFLGISVLVGGHPTCDGKPWRSGEYCVTSGEETWIERPGETPDGVPAVVLGSDRRSYDEVRGLSVARAGLVIGASSIVPGLVVWGVWYRLRRRRRHPAPDGARGCPESPRESRCSAT